jgi:peptidoglycan/xylan/chitin deacetylase (PgdA/CDA1 family)
MPVDPTYLTYANRRAGNDHDMYAASYLPDRKPVMWPGNKGVAVWIVPIVEVFPLDMKPEPINPPGGMTRPYPDYWNYTSQDYGNRVGIYRILDALENRGMTASCAVNAALADKYPRVLADIAARHEVIAHGRDMGTIHGDYLSEEAEAEVIGASRARLAKALGHAPRGWFAPAWAVSRNTTRLAAAAGFDYSCDWAVDELPVPMTGSAQGLTAMPLSYELSDTRLILEYKQMAWDWAEQVIDSLAFLSAESARKGAGRILALPVHPWIVGAPLRIGAFERILDTVAADPQTWVATGSQILDAWQEQQP